jgi:HEAT repeat protein
MLLSRAPDACVGNYRVAVVLRWTVVTLFVASSPNFMTAEDNLGAMDMTIKACVDRALRGDSSKIRDSALTELLRRREQSALSVRLFQMALSDRSPETRGNAANALGEFGELAAESVPALIKCLGDEDHSVRMYSASGLLRIGPKAADASPQLMKMLVDDEPNRCIASTALGRIGLSAVPVVVRGFRDPNPAVRRWSAHAIENMEPKDAITALEPLLGLLGEQPADVRNSTIAAISSMGAPALPRLHEFAKTSDEKFLPATFHAIRRISPKDPETLTLAKRLLESSRSESWRYALCYALHPAGPHDKPLVFQIAKHLVDDDPEVVTDAAKLLGDIGEAAEPVCHLLLPNLKSGNVKVRVFSYRALALAKARPETSFNPLVLGLKDDDPDARSWAAEGLGELGPRAASGLPELTAALKDEDQDVRDAVKRAIKKIRSK